MQKRIHPQKRRRRSIRMPKFDYTMSLQWFITICTHNRECVLGEIVNDEMRLNEIGKIIEECWLAIPDHFLNVILGEYMIMPNHIHGILEIVDNSHVCRGTACQNDSDICRGVACYAPTGSQEYFSKISPVPKSLGTIIRSFKSGVTKHVNKLRNTPSASFWQRNYYEHGIRNDKALERIENYIKENPFFWNEDENHPENLHKHR